MIEPLFHVGALLGVGETEAPLCSELRSPVDVGLSATAAFAACFPPSAVPGAGSKVFRPSRMDFVLPPRLGFQVLEVDWITLLSLDLGLYPAEAGYWEK